MSKVTGIFGQFHKEELTFDEQNIVESCKDFIKESKEFTNYLIIEDDRNKNNLRWYSSKDFFASGMTMLIIHQELIAGTIEEYKTKYGETLVIKNIESVFEKVILHNQNTIRSYEYLIDFNECKKRIMEFKM